MNSINNNYGDFHDFDVQLYRDSLSRPWGFRIQGGADFNFPLTVQRVFSGSPSEVKLLRGDVILALDGYDVGRLTHKQAQDVIRVAGAFLKIRVRRAGSKSFKTATASPQIRRPHSTTPRQDPASFYFQANQPPKATWQPPASSQNTSSTLGNFGVQYGPTKTSSVQHRPVERTRQSPQFSSQSPHDEEDLTLKKVEDSLQKLTMNHFSNEEDEVDYSFTKKSVSERRKLFQSNDNTDNRPRSTSCTPSLRAINYSSQFSCPSTPQMTTSYTEPTRNTVRSTANVMSSSYSEGSRNRLGTPSWQNPSGGFNFGWAPSPEKLAAARLAPHTSSVSQIQHSVMRSRDSSRENSPEQDNPWRGAFGGGAPLMRSTSVSVLQETPTRSTVQRFESTTPRINTQHLQQEPSSPSWRVYPSSVNSWSPAHQNAKKFSTSATILVGQSSTQQHPIRKVRRFSTSSTPMDGTMSLDRRHHEPLMISIGSTCQADYHPAYPANVYQQVDKSWLKPSRQSLQRSASQKAPSRHTTRTEVGTYRPLQQSFSSHARSQSASADPDYMSSDF